MKISFTRETHALVFVTPKDRLVKHATYIDDPSGLMANCCKFKKNMNYAYISEFQAKKTSSISNIIKMQIYRGINAQLSIKKDCHTEAQLDCTAAMKVKAPVTASDS